MFATVSQELLQFGDSVTIKPAAMILFHMDVICGVHGHLVLLESKLEIASMEMFFMKRNLVVEEGEDQIQPLALHVVLI
jgi:hypothetical protein